MAVYEYRCVRCDVCLTSDRHGAEKTCVHYCGGELRRVYSFAFHRPLQPHFNPGIGAPVTSKQDLDDKLKRKSEEVTARTGIPHDYAQADLRDRDVFPVTTDGLGSTYDAHPPDHPIRKVIEGVK